MSKLIWDMSKPVWDMSKLIWTCPDLVVPIYGQSFLLFSTAPMCPHTYLYSIFILPIYLKVC